MSRELTPQETAERSLIKTYRKSIWNPFIAAVKRYELIEPGDRIAVCISGGKDSVILAKLMQELQRHTSQPFELVFMVMDPGYKPENRKLIEDNAALLGSHGRTTTTCNSSSAPAGSRRSGRRRGTAWAAASGRRSNSCCGS